MHAAWLNNAAYHATILQRICELAVLPQLQGLLPIFCPFPHTKRFGAALSCSGEVDSIFYFVS